MDQRDIQSLFQPPGIQIPENMGSYDPYSQYTTNPFMGGGRMPMGAGSLLMSMFGMKMWPLIGQGQSSMYDAAWQREHDVQMMGLARKTVSSWYPFQNMGGMNENSAITQIVSSLMSDPDGIAAKIMSPVLGGNPIAAQMSSFAKLQGIGGAGLGTGQGISTGQLSRALEDFNKQYYKSDVQPINQDQGAALEKQINASLTPEALDTLGLNSEDIKGLLDQHHQVLGGSKAFNKIDNVSRALSGITSRIASGEAVTPEQAMAGLTKDELGDSYDKIAAQVTKTFKDAPKDYTDAAKEALGQDERIKDKGLDLDKLIQAFKDNKLDKKDQSDAVYDALKKAAPTLAAAFASQSAVKSINDTAAATSEIGQLMLMQNIFRGMDYSHNLGLSYNTLTTARDDMIKDRLVSPTSDIPDFNKMSAMFAGADGGRVPSLITAAKGLWGNDMPDHELMTHISSYVGNSRFNASNPEDTDRLETSMRNLKATARESNINLNTLLNFHEQAQSMAAQNSRLQSIGGIELADVLTQVTQQVATAATNPSESNNWMIRYQGGTSGQVRNAYQNRLEAMANPTIGAMAGIRTYISENVADDKQRKELLDKYDTWAQGGSKFSRDQYGARDFMMDAFAGRTDVSVARGWQYAYNNDLAAAKGYDDAAREGLNLKDPTAKGFNLSAELPVGMEAATVNARIMARLGNNKEAVNAAAIKDLGLKKGTMMTPLELKSEYEKQDKMAEWLLNPQISQTAAQGENGILALATRANNAGVFTQERIDKNPLLKANDLKNKEAIKASAYLDQEFDRNMGAMRPDTITRLVQAFASGDFSEGAVEPFLKAMGVGSDATARMTVTHLASAVNKINSAATPEDVAVDMGMNSADAAVIKGLGDASTKYGIKGSDLQAIADSTSLDDLKKKNIIQSSKLPNAEEYTALKSLAKQGLGVAGLSSIVYDDRGNPVIENGGIKTKFYDRSFSTSDMQGYAKQDMTDKTLRAIWESKQAEKTFGKLVTGELGLMDNLPDPAMQGLGKAIDALSLPDSRGNKDYEAGIGIVSKAKEDNAETAGKKFALSDSQTKLLQAMDQTGSIPQSLSKMLKYSDGQYKFDSKDDADKAVKVLHEMLDNPHISGLIQKSGFLAAERASETHADATAVDLPGLVKDILKNLAGLKDITKAITDLTKAVNTQ